jgi:hypothetical protein
MDLWKCRWIIERRLLGVRELRDAQRIEHFLQPEFLTHVTMREMGIDQAEPSLKKKGRVFPNA